MRVPLRIIDLTDGTMAYATRLLADLGGDVVRVEDAGAAVDGSTERAVATA